MNEEEEEEARAEAEEQRRRRGGKRREGGMRKRRKNTAVKREEKWKGKKRSCYERGEDLKRRETYASKNTLRSSYRSEQNTGPPSARITAAQKGTELDLYG